MGVGEPRQFFEVTPMVGMLTWVAAYGINMRRAA